jgi:hypothetical protein
MEILKENSFTILNAFFNLPSELECDGVTYMLEYRKEEGKHRLLYGNSNAGLLFISSFKDDFLLVIIEVLSFLYNFYNDKEINKKL